MGRYPSSKICGDKGSSRNFRGGQSRANTEHSYTFHGRDVYAYTGAKLASGHISFEEVGPELSVDKIVEIPTVPTEVGSDYVKVQLIFWMFDSARFGPRLRGKNFTPCNRSLRIALK